MSEMKITFIESGFEDILKSPALESLVASKAQQIAMTANANGNCSGFKFSTNMKNLNIGSRISGKVSSTDYESAKAESEYHALLNAVH